MFTCNCPRTIYPLDSSAGSVHGLKRWECTWLLTMCLGRRDENWGTVANKLAPEPNRFIMPEPKKGTMTAFGMPSLSANALPPANTKSANIKSGSKSCIEHQCASMLQYMMLAGRTDKGKACQSTTLAACILGKLRQIRQTSMRLCSAASSKMIFE